MREKPLNGYDAMLKSLREAIKAAQKAQNKAAKPKK
jgi:hypothetical protein